MDMGALCSDECMCNAIVWPATGLLLLLKVISEGVGVGMLVIRVKEGLESPEAEVLRRFC